MLRLQFLHHRKLLPKLCRCAWDSLTMFIHEALIAGMFSRWYPCAADLWWHGQLESHVHALITDTSWDIDALKCAKCGRQMKVISFIEQAFVIRRILKKHLDLWEDTRPSPEPLEMVCEPCTDYVPWQDDVPEIEVG